MPTETMLKRIILSKEACEKLAAGFDEPREPYVCPFDMEEEERKGREALRQLISYYEKSVAMTEAQL
jgi:hypothetical protein